jgi:hypothetical protein
MINDDVKIRIKDDTIIPITIINNIITTVAGCGVAASVSIGICRIHIDYNPLLLLDHINYRNRLLAALKDIVPGCTISHKAYLSYPWSCIISIDYDCNDDFVM